MYNDYAWQKPAGNRERRLGQERRMSMEDINVVHKKSCWQAVSQTFPGAEEKLKKVLESAERVITLRHIPLYCDTLHEDTVKNKKLPAWNWA